MSCVFLLCKREETSITYPVAKEKLPQRYHLRSRMKGVSLLTIHKNLTMRYQISTQVTEVKMVYYNKVKAADRPQVKSSLDAYTILASNWDEGTIGLFEEFYILLLDRANRVLGKYLVSQGGMTGTVVDAKMVFACALKTKANSLILCHNHPSSNLKASQADLDLTKKLQQGGELLDIAVLDHLIISPEGGYYSFADEGLL